jgi:F0F1-type ATP synthase assembly protein I
MPPLVAFIIGVMVGNLFGMFLLSLFVVAARADDDAV